jgi:CBS domain-containing protein
VVDDKGNFQGVIRAVDVLDFLGGGDKYSKFLSGRFNTKAEAIMNTKADAVTPKHTIQQTLSGMVKRNLDHCPLLVGKKLSGMVTEASFIHRVRGKTGVKVRDAMVHKPMVAKNHMTVADVAGIMVRTGYRRLPVTEKGILIGLVTPHDIISHLRGKNNLSGLKEMTLPVTEVMNRNVVTVRPGDDLALAIDKMRSGYSCLPVVEENELLGILTERDVLEQIR